MPTQDFLRLSFVPRCGGSTEGEDVSGNKEAEVIATGSEEHELVVDDLAPEGGSQGGWMCGSGGATGRGKSRRHMGYL